jgi:hypothetical protein
MMRKVLNDISMDGVVVIGEGEKDEAPMLYCGEWACCSLGSASALPFWVAPVLHRLASHWLAAGCAMRLCRQSSWVAFMCSWVLTVSQRLGLRIPSVPAYTDILLSTLCAQESTSAAARHQLWTLLWTHLTAQH